MVNVRQMTEMKKVWKQVVLHIGSDMLEYFIHKANEIGITYKELIYLSVHNGTEQRRVIAK